MASSEPSPSISESPDPTQPLEPSNIPEIPSLQLDDSQPSSTDALSPRTLSIPDQTSSSDPGPGLDPDPDSETPPEPSLAQASPNPNPEPTPKSNPDTTAAPPQQPKPRKPQLTRDQRRSILLMRSLGYTYLRIAQHLNITVRGVQYTCEQRSASPKRRPGRTRILTDEKMDEIESFIRASLENRQLNYAGLIEKMGLDVKEDTLVQSLRRRGWTRQMAFLRAENVAPVNGGRGRGNTVVTVKPVRTWLTCREDEELEEEGGRVLEVVRAGRKRKRAG